MGSLPTGIDRLSASDPVSTRLITAKDAPNPHSGFSRRCEAHPRYECEGQVHSVSRNYGAPPSRAGPGNGFERCVAHVTNEFPLEFPFFVVVERARVWHSPCPTLRPCARRTDLRQASARPATVLESGRERCGIRRGGAPRTLQDRRRFAIGSGSRNAPTDRAADGSVVQREDG